MSHDEWYNADYEKVDICAERAKSLVDMVWPRGNICIEAGARLRAEIYRLEEILIKNGIEYSDEE